MTGKRKLTLNYCAIADENDPDEFFAMVELGPFRTIEDAERGAKAMRNALAESIDATVSEKPKNPLDKPVGNA